VASFLLAGVDKLVAAGCDLLIIASNTGHICVPTVEAKHPDLDILHIADCSAYQLKELGMSRVGLVGTQPTMEESYLHDRLAQHGIETVIPVSARRSIGSSTRSYLLTSFGRNREQRSWTRSGHLVHTVSKPAFSAALRSSYWCSRNMCPNLRYSCRQKCTFSSHLTSSWGTFPSKTYCPPKRCS